MSVKRYRFFGQVQEVGEFGETTDCGWSVFHPWVKYEDYAALLATTQWRPIETAPMDGTDILCWCVEPEFEGEENPHTEQRVCFFGQMQEDYSCWMSHYGYEQRPTHWMPLPKPPSV